jgi:hypothetical protein
MRPADCALVVAVPLERAEFMSDMRVGTDFLDQFRMQQRTRTLDILWSLYAASVAAASVTIARAKRRGVMVCTRSALTDFARCMEKYQVVTLVAHWRSARFRANEIVDPAAVRRLMLDGHATAESSTQPTAAEMAEALNHWLERQGAHVAGPRDDSGAAAAETRRQYALWDARLEVQLRLGAAIRAGGPSVEFVEGGVDVDDVVAAVPIGFSGVLDLTVCNSTLLAEEVRRRCRSGLVIANAFPATLHIRMELYDAAMRLVQHQRVSYQDAVFMVRSSLRRQS